jgi:hypothetical protein
MSATKTSACAGRRDDDVGVNQRSFEILERMHAATDAGGQLLGASGRAVRDDQVRALTLQRPRGQIRHFSRANQQHGSSRETFEDFLCVIDGHRAERHRIARDLGLAPHPPRDPVRALETGAQDRAGDARADRGFMRLLHLAQDLGLADDLRVQAGGDAEQMVDRLDVDANVEMRSELQLGGARAVRQIPAQRRDGRVRIGRRGIHLDAVAGRKQRRLAHGREGRHRANRPDDLLWRDCQPLAHTERRGPVRQAHHEKIDSPRHGPYTATLST